MSTKVERPISAEQAARLIYRTETPDPTQVGAVCALMQRGELKQSVQRRFTTTRGAVAEYLAAGELRRCQTHPSPSKRAVGQASNRRLRQVYRELLHDYFRSLVFCGRPRDRSPQFRRAVLGMQIVILLALLGIGGWTIRTMLAGEPLIEEPWMQAGRQRVVQHDAGEKRIVEAWLRANRKSAVLLDLLPAHARPGGKALRARFRWTWKEGATRLEDQVFILDGAEILRIEDPDAEDDAVERRLSDAAS